MSTITYPGNAPGIVYGGGVYDGSAIGTPFIFSGENIQPRSGLNSEIRVNFTGTQIEMRVYGSGTFTWTVDGGATQNNTPSGGMQWITLATGLSDTTHTLVVKPLGDYMGYDSLFRVTGSAPALSTPSGYAGTQFNFNSSGCTRDNSSYLSGTVEGYTNLQTRGSLRFKATTTTILVWNRYDVNSPLGLAIDDDPTTIVRASPSSGWGWTAFTGLDGGAEHSYRLIVPNGVYVWNIMASGFNTTALTAWPADYWQGDSITAASNITDGDAAPNWTIWYAIKAKRGWQIEGTPGGTAATQGIAQDTHPGTASPTPDRVILAWGRNDDSGTSIPTWNSAITTIITQIHSDLPTTNVVWLGIFDTSSVTSTRGTYNTNLSSTIATFGSSYVTYLSTDGTGTVTTGDGTHPDAAGAAVIGAYLFSNLPSGATPTDNYFYIFPHNF